MQARGVACSLLMHSSLSTFLMPVAFSTTAMAVRSFTEGVSMLRQFTDARVKPKCAAEVHFQDFAV